jgi:hypothetical protein
MITLGLTVPGPNQDYLRAHGHCRENRAELETSPFCGCFYCFAIYPSTEIAEWVDEERLRCARSVASIQSSALHRGIQSLARFSGVCMPTASELARLLGFYGVMWLTLPPSR